MEVVSGSEGLSAAVALAGCGPVRHEAAAHSVWVWHPPKWSLHIGL